MAFLAMVIIGIITYFTLPVSLLPDIAIPDITVQVSMPNASARELENTVVSSLRTNLMQVSKLRDIKSETRDESAVINLRFEFGTNTDLAFIEVNEKVDAAMSYLPREVERPRVIKASATDIPVFYLNLTVKETGDSKAKFLAMSEFAETVIKRRIEQLPEVSMVDVTGLIASEVRITPDMNRFQTAGFTLDDLEAAINTNNLEAGNMLIRDGFFEYNVKFSTLLHSVKDIEDIYIRKSDRIYQLKDICKVETAPVEERGYSIVNGKRAVTLAIIKQSEENMDNMRTALNKTVYHFKKLYPDIEFSINRNQTELLDYTISNLKQDFIFGFILICIVAFFFLGDAKSPLVIAVCMMVSLIVSFLFFYLFNRSINIISLSGLILALGMMIDNAIITTENISQYREKGLSLENACIKGTTEVLSPILSSTLTSIAVFLPLIFLSGIAGALFIDEAFAVSIGQLTSYLAGAMLLPVLYKMIYSKTFTKKDLGVRLKKHQDKTNKILFGFYDKLLQFTFRRKTLNALIFIAVLPLCALMFNIIPKSGMPEVEQVELLTFIDWGENIHLDENLRRTEEICKAVDSTTVEHSAYIGRQDYILNNERKMSSSECEIYIKAHNRKLAMESRQKIEHWIKSKYPHATAAYSPPETVFEKIFVTGESEIVTQLYPLNKERMPDASEIRAYQKKLDKASGEQSIGVSFDEEMNIVIDRSKLMLYNISYNEIEKIVKTAFRDNEVALLRSYQRFLPISIEGDEKSISEILNNTLVRSQSAGSEQTIPLSSLVTVSASEGLKTIIAGKNGEYIPVEYQTVNDYAALMENTREEIKKEGGFDVAFSGSYFSNKKMISELIVVLLISILLMYFILAAQFESFLQPFIVLAEIPIDIAFALVTLWLLGHTLNLMSAIGIVVSCGIIINDSILKIDLINELRKQGLPLMEAIHTAGHRRLRAIIMTMLTSILAMVPMLFTNDLGSELQKPLAIAMISSMLIGTLVSLGIIPLIYWRIYRVKS
jgi:multidrug efflux pump subunit AcrB